MKSRCADMSLYDKIDQGVTTHSDALAHVVIVVLAAVVGVAVGAAIVVLALAAGIV